MPASMPWVRLREKSTTSRPLAAQTQREALVGDHALQVYLVDDERLDYLGFDYGSRHLEDGFVGEEQAPFGYCPHIAGEPEAAQEVEKPGGEDTSRFQVSQVALGKAELLQVGENILEACADEVSPVWGVAADGQAEGSALTHPALKVGLGHGQLIQVGEEPQVLEIVLGHGANRCPLSQVCALNHDMPRAHWSRTHPLCFSPLGVSTCVHSRPKSYGAVHRSPSSAAMGR